MDQGRDPIADITKRLLAVPETVADRAALVPDWHPLQPHKRGPVDAAVLIALVERTEGFSVLYTERARHLRSHSGQMAFPGGKIDPEDASVAAAALREAEEEVALCQADAEVIGYLPSYYTGTNYLITPVVAVVRPSGPFAPNPLEVASLFEVPLSLLCRPESYGTFRIRRQEEEHATWQIVYEGRSIWGITANLTRRFYEMALAGGER